MELVLVVPDIGSRSGGVQVSPSPAVSPAKAIQVKPSPSEDESPPEEENDQKPAVADDPDSLKTNPNPLNPAGDSLDKLIQVQFNDDVWKTMLGELPCLEATESCIGQLQGERSPLPKH